MSEPKFTPGPWLKRTGGGAQYIVHGEHIICSIPRSYPNLKNEANLIAAAPELYEALNHLAAAVVENYGKGWPNDDLDRAIDAAWAALAKARGETP